MKRFLSVFVFAVTLMIGSITYYMHRRIGGAWPVDALLLLVAGLIWSLPVLHWTSQRDQDSKMVLMFQRSSFVAMGLFSWLFVLTLFRDLMALVLGTALASDQSERWLRTVTGYGVAGGALCFCLVGYWISRRIRVREILVVVPDLPAALAGFRIAQISDLHIGPMVGRADCQKVVDLINAAAPDMIAMTGDIVDGNLRDHLDSIEPFRSLQAQGRTYFVPGNHEYYWDYEGWLDALSARGVTVLCNSGVALQTAKGARMWIGGVTDPAALTTQLGEAPNVQKAVAGGMDFALRVLLSHRPDLAGAADAAGFQIQLSGHTHGGQFFPWTQVARLAHRHFIGLIRVGKLWLYVSPGTGSWGPPLRFGTQPEVTVLTLTP